MESLIQTNELEFDISQKIELEMAHDPFKLLILSVKYEYQGEYQKSLEVAKRALKLLDQNQNNINSKIYTFAAEVQIYYSTVRIDPSKENKCENIDEQIKKLNQKQFDQTSIDYYNYNFFSAIYYTAKSTYYFYNSNIKKAMEYNKKAIQRWKNIGEKEGVNLVKIDQQFCHIRLGEFDRAIQLSDELLENIDPKEETLTYCHALLSKAEVFKLKGEYSTAADLLKESYDLSIKLKNKGLISHSSRFLASIYSKQGLYKQALNLQKKVLSIFEKTSNSYFISLILNDLGNTSKYQENFKKAESYYLKSIEKAKKVSAYEEILTSYYNLILNEVVNEQDKDKLINYLDKIEEYSCKTDNPRFIHLKDLCSAIIYQHEDRLYKQFKAIELYSKLVEDSEVYFEYRLTSVYYMTELLLMEYNITSNFEIFDEIEGTLKLLHEIGSNLQSYPVLIDYHLLSLKVEIEKGNEKKGLKHLVQARKIANQSGSSDMQTYIEREEKLLKDEMDMIKNVSKTDVNQIQKFKSVSTYLRELQIGRVPQIKPLKIDPQIVMIISEGGVNLYSKELEKDLILEVNLAASFLTAILSFSKEAFSNRSNFDLIKFGDEKLIVKEIGDVNNKLILCYIYRGYTPKAIKQLNKFGDLLFAQKSLYNQLLTFNKSKSDEIQLSELIDDIFR